MLAIVIFVVGSALCGLATSMYELAAFRAFQGIGAGGIMPLALAVIGDIIPPRERARYQGYMMAVFASASVLGPVLGGLLAGTNDFLGVAGWRWIFYINVPIAAVALIVIARVLKLDYVRRERRIDWWGSVMLAVGLVPLLVVAEQGQSWGWASAGALRLLRPRRRRPGAVRLDPAPDGRRRAAAAAAVPQPHLLRRLGPGHHHRHGHVRRPVRHPAVPADRQGRLTDQVRPAPAAAGRRADARLPRPPGG